MATLDPLGLTVSTSVVEGNSADDPLYEPEITRVRETTGKRGLLYVGDKKMAALELRAFIGGGGDYYLCPLGLKQLSESERGVLIKEFFARQHEPQIIIRPETDEPIGVGFEIAVVRTATFTGGYRTTWTERILAFSSFERARSDKRHHLEGIVNFSVETQVVGREVRAWRDRPARTECKHLHEVQVELDQEALCKRRQELGWGFYGTNHNRGQLPLKKAILAYRGQYTIKQGFGRFKGRRLGLLPLFLKLDLHVAGLIHLLAIGLASVKSKACMRDKPLAPRRARPPS